MSRTVRRKAYIAPSVFRKYQYKDGYLMLAGEELESAIRIWHMDRQRSSVYNPSKIFRRIEQRVQRARDRHELVRYAKNPDYEVLCLPKLPLPYWD